MDVTSIVVGGASEKCTVNYIEVRFISFLPIRGSRGGTGGPDPQHPN